MLALLVLISTSGVGVTRHYCGKRLASVSVFGDMGCACGAKDASHGCCRTERDFFQVDDDLTVTSPQPIAIGSVHAVMVAAYRLASEFGDSGHLKAPVHYRPPIPDRDMCVLFRSLLV